LVQKTKRKTKSREKAGAVKTRDKALKSTAKTVKSRDKAQKTTKKKTVSGRTSGKPASARKKPAAKTKRVTERTSKQKISKSTKRIIKESTTMGAELKKVSSSGNKAFSGSKASRGLLRQTKTTTAALSHLGKGIEFIHKKDFKKARSEFTTLVRSFPEETEILARARSYLQICDREENAQKNPEITADQLYSLGVLEHNKANYDTAIAYFQQSLKKHPDADYIYYSVAASLARKGDLKASVEHLKKAIELNEDSRIYARNDDDFSAFESNEEFAELLGISPNPVKDPQ